MKKFYNLPKVIMFCTLFLSSILVSAQTFNYTGANQTYTVPAGVTDIQIECWGAQGGDGDSGPNSAGGNGAYVSGEFTVTPGETLTIIVGGTGEDGVQSLDGGGGGGGSFAIRDAGNVPLIIGAGGGGGGYQVGYPGQPGQATTVAGGGYYAPASVGEGGNTDNGGGGGNGSGGGGWNSDGLTNNWATGGIMQGGAGGVSSHVVGDGGFGGGGAAYHGGGGGGGYTGGGGGGYTVSAGGGGSYNTGSNQTNTAGIQSGDGQLIITVLCTGLTTTVSSTSVCFGDSVTLHAASTQGGTISWDNGITDSVAFNPPLGTTVYTATSTESTDCGFSISIDVNPLPTVDAGVDINLCTPMDTVLSGSGAVTYVWDNGITDGVSFTPSNGTTTYTVTGTDNNGCENTDMVDVSLGGPTVTAVITHETSGADGAIDLTVSGGSGTYSYSWSNGPTTQDINNLIPGNYQVIVDDGICTKDTTFTIVNVLNIGELLENEVQIYPNPTTDVVFIDLNSAFTYQIIDISGKIVLSGQSVDQEIVNLEHLKSGVYFINLNAGDRRLTKKLVKK